MYRTIDASFWTDPKIRKISPNGRLLFLYLITNPHTHVSGIYYLPWPIAQHETGLSKPQLDTLSDTLSNVGLALFDRPNEIVWVIRMFKFQGSGSKNTLSAAHHLSKDVHNSFLISQFLEAYPEVKVHFKNRVSIPYTVGATPDSPLPTPDSGERRTDIEGAAAVAADVLIAHGEFQRARLTAEQYDKLNAKLNGTLREYIDRFDRWVNEAPDAKANGIRRKERHAYESILNWHERDVKDGKIGVKTHVDYESKADRLERRQRENHAEVLRRIDAASGNGDGSGN